MITSTSVAIFAYGSLVNQLASANYENSESLDVKNGFQVAQGLKFPVALSRISSLGTEKRRVTLVVDPQAKGKKIFYAVSNRTTLASAMDNLRSREGAPNTKNISFIKKLEENEIPESGTTLFKLNENETWCAKIGDLSKETAQQVAKWANGNHFKAVIWASFPSNIETAEPTPEAKNMEVLKRLEQDAVLLANTKEYIANLPCRTKFQQRIMDMPVV